MVRKKKRNDDPPRTRIKYVVKEQPYGRPDNNSLPEWRLELKRLIEETLKECKSGSA